MAELEEPERKLALIYNFIHDYIKEKYDAGFFKDEKHTFPKAQLYQMYYAIARLDAEKFTKLDFTLNFGISQEVKA